MKLKCETAFQPALMAQRASEQAIGYLMQQGIENADCLSLAAGFVDPKTLPVSLVQQTMDRLLQQQSFGEVALQYGTTSGSDDLREVFRSYLGDVEGDPERVAGLPLNRILLTTGSQQLLALVSQALFSEGDICLVAAPTYFVYLGVLDGVGAEVIPVKTDEDGMCPEALNTKLQQLADQGQLHRVKLVYVVSYHDNPAGISVSAERRPKLLEVVKRWSQDQRIFLLEDAAYRELQYDGPEHPSIWSFDEGYRDGTEEHVVLTQTFSKSFAPGLRVGLGVLPEPLIKPVTDLKGNEDFGSAHLNQNVMAEVLKTEDYHNHVRQLRDSYRTKRDTMLSAAEEYFSDIDGVSWLRPNGGLYVWMTLPESVETGFSGNLFRQATQHDKVMYVPGELCYPSSWSDRPRNQMRLSYGVLDLDRIREGMKRLSNAVRSVL